MGPQALPMTMSAGACLPLLPVSQPTPLMVQGVSGAGKTTLMDVLAGRKRQGEQLQLAQPAAGQGRTHRAGTTPVLPLGTQGWQAGDPQFRHCSACLARPS